jgi:pSer/pThr/pTyr-binding forkhead associated (FHA) protein
MPKVSVYRGRNHLFDHWIEKDSVVIGRSADADIPLDSPAASRQHCRIVRKQGVYVLEEMGAKNGLFVNGQYCNVKRLRNGDSIEIADHVLLFRRTREEAEAEKDAGNAYRIGAQAIDQAMTVRKGDSAEVRLDAGQRSAQSTTAVSPEELQAMMEALKKKQQAHLEIRSGEELLRHPLERTREILGWHPSCTLIMPDKRIWPWGKRAAEIEALDKGRFQVVRLGDWVTITVNGEKVDDSRELADGDKIQVGPSEMRFQAATVVAKFQQKKEQRKKRR